ncbi:sarcoplasmic calcium-binding [Brachionus plicatilis]|uniref:Sarcoplasmic calcium-binding n=1 Tax=Brachionus plicatilis TaxID=10195 RepID=A0A3M7P5U8_BRAPC|nr:sarcoplasmic calcium-binding [Brachionus plicatilis]
MVEQLLKKKVATLFQRLDVDGNGSIDQTDLAKWADKLVSYGNIDADGEANLRAKMDTMWKEYFDPADTDKSGSISFDEMYAYFETAVADDNKKDVLKSILPLIFDAIDSDKSASVTKLEFANYFKSLNINDPMVANQVFESMDVNSDGTLSKEEFTEFGKNYFTCADMDPASLLFGPLID